MIDPNQIPAATIGDIDLSTAAKLSPEDAAEIKRLGGLLDEGRDTIGDLILLCELLNKHGKTSKAEELLRCNIVVNGDEAHKAYVRHYGNTAELALSSAIAEFATQFGVQVHTIDGHRFLKVECESRPLKLTDNMEPQVRQFLANECVISFSYDPRGCTADIGAEKAELYHSYILMRHLNGLWHMVSSEQI